MASPYKVSYSASVRNTLNELCARAAQRNQGNEILRAIKVIDERLQSDPLAFGDPWNDLPEAKLIVLVRVVPPLTVIYGVHKEIPVVFPKVFLPFPTDAF